MSLATYSGYCESPVNKPNFLGSETPPFRWTPTCLSLRTSTSMSRLSGGGTVKEYTGIDGMARFTSIWFIWGFSYRHCGHRGYLQVGGAWNGHGDLLCCWSRRLLKTSSFSNCIFAQACLIGPALAPLAGGTFPLSSYLDLPSSTSGFFQV
jgi:hypothetical protein